MHSREVQQELEVLTQELGMDRDSALATLGLQPDDPLLTETADLAPVTSAPDTHPTDHIVEMFPEVSRSQILKLYDDYKGDCAAISDELLTLQTIEREQTADLAHQLKEAEVRTGKPVSIKSLRKNQREHKRQVRKQQQQMEREQVDIAFIMDQLRVSGEEARQLYWTHNSDVTAACLAKMPKQPLASVVVDGSGTSTVVSEGNNGAVTVRTHRPQANSQARGASEPVREVGVYGSMSIRELQQRARETEARIASLTAAANHPQRNQPHRSIRAQDAAAELANWRNEQLLINLALNKPNWLRQNELPASKLDLHGYTLEQAQIMAADAIRKFKDGNTESLEIITGAGRHSTQGRAVIKPWLKTYLRSQNVRMRENEGSFIISQKPIK